VGQTKAVLGDAVTKGEAVFGRNSSAAEPCGRVRQFEGGLRPEEFSPGDQGLRVATDGEVFFVKAAESFHAAVREVRWVVSVAVGVTVETGRSGRAIQSSTPPDRQAYIQCSCTSIPSKCCFCVTGDQRQYFGVAQLAAHGFALGVGPNIGVTCSASPDGFGRHGAKSRSSTTKDPVVVHHNPTLRGRVRADVARIAEPDGMIPRYA